MGLILCLVMSLCFILEIARLHKQLRQALAGWQKSNLQLRVFYLQASAVFKEYNRVLAGLLEQCGRDSEKCDCEKQPCLMHNPECWKT